jgi:hypothetical protein
MLKLVHFEAKFNIPIMHHDKMVQLVLNLSPNTPLGNRHKNRRSATRMLEVISDKMHEALVDHILKTDTKFSIIMDASTDMKNKHYLVVLFQCLEENTPVIYFYKILETGVDETADGLTKTLMDQIRKEKPAFLDHFKRHLFGFAVDGAAVNLGVKNGIDKKLSDEVGTKLYSIHCMPHRLELVFKSAREGIPLLARYVATINGAHNFYDSHSHKRKETLVAHAAAVNQKLYSLTKIFTQRWIGSEFAADIRILNSIVFGSLDYNCSFIFASLSASVLNSEPANCRFMCWKVD